MLHSLFNIPENADGRTLVYCNNEMENIKDGKLQSRTTETDRLVKMEK